MSMRKSQKCGLTALWANYDLAAHEQALRIAAGMLASFSDCGKDPGLLRALCRSSSAA